MKKLILSLIALFMLSALAFTQHQDTLWYNNNQIEEIRSFNSDSELDGKCVRFFEDGSFSAIAYYKNGVKDGLWRVWHPNGNIAYELQYKKGERIGVWKSYDPEGKLVFEKKY